MNWEIISGISGLISAVIAVISLFKIKPFVSNNEKSYKDKIKEKYFSYVLACCGWVLCVLSWAWLSNEYGSLITDREMKEVLGITLSFPAIILFTYGLKRIGAS